MRLQCTTTAFIFAALGASARDTFTTKELLQGIKLLDMLGNSCYPEGTFTLGSREVIPPCVSEQMISQKCVDLVAPKEDNPTEMVAFRSCLLGSGSSYEKDIYGCLKCKRLHSIHSPGEDKFFNEGWSLGLKAFQNADPPTTNAWGYLNKAVDWSRYPGDPKGTKERDIPVEEYYSEAPRPQGIGRFTFKSTPYHQSVPAKVRARSEPVTGNNGTVITVSYHEQNGNLAYVSASRDASAA